jgi:acetoin utilization deacetylase AcuC-like enzyme
MRMKIIFHERFYEVYSSDPAAAAGRMESITKVVEGQYEFIPPDPATDEDLKRVHTEVHIQRTKSSRQIYEIGLLAAGGAILAAEMAWQGEPSFGLIRPPGHHASPDSCWGFCYFNNMAVGIQSLIAKGKVEKAFILDFDLHFGDGTDCFFKANQNVVYFHPPGAHGRDCVRAIQNRLEHAERFDILGVSAGFDRHVDDWGGLLETADYGKIGALIKSCSRRICQGRRFALLEGGYNHTVLGQNVESFLSGLSN